MYGQSTPQQGDCQVEEEHFVMHPESLWSDFQQIQVSKAKTKRKCVVHILSAFETQDSCPDPTILIGLHHWIEILV